MDYESNTNFNNKELENFCLTAIINNIRTKEELNKELEKI